MTNKIFLNVDKKLRAEQIYILVVGTKSPKTDHEQYLKDRHTELLDEAKVKISDKETAIESIYKALGGKLQTAEQVAKRKAFFARKKKLEKSEEAEANGKIEDADDEDDADEDE